jgi:peptidyl-prolyl cis-trans isomerase A (cyclophilin A)
MRPKAVWSLLAHCLLASAACSAPSPPPSTPATILLPVATAVPPPLHPRPEPVSETPPLPAPVPVDRRALLDPSLASVTAPEVFRARFATTRGDFVVEVHRDWAPHGADRFYNLVRIGFCDRTRFFRAIDRFMVQWGLSGDPAVSAAWRDAHIHDDPNTHPNARGIISLARSMGPDSSTTQVFVNTVDNTRLDAMGFTPFGEVVEGMSVFDAFYTGYGEGEPGGRGPNQARIQSDGDAYLDGFPKLDRIVGAHIE